MLRRELCSLKYSSSHGAPTTPDTHAGMMPAGIGYSLRRDRGIDYEWGVCKHTVGPTDIFS